ncbi:MAG TPA: ABC transporter permease [Tepidisphaeraceae bacterium]|jgi:hypothetical protein
MIRQTLAIFLDAYRDLNARKLFWVTLILSAFVVLSFAIVGVDAKGLSIVTFHMELPQAKLLYKQLFSLIVIGLWLTWAATLLALVSTAGIFPDFISGGSVDLYLAKPIGRGRLFVTKYLSGLLFVTLQVLVVACGSFLILGIRGHDWNLRLFWAVPIVVCFYSYLFGFCVLLGVQTRSTIAALLLTLLFWTFLAVLDRGEPALLTFRNAYETQAHEKQERSESADMVLLRAQANPQSAALLPSLQESSDSARREADDAAHTARVLRNVHAAVYGIKTVTPKTTDTLGLLDRYLFPSNKEAEYAGGVSPDQQQQRSPPPFDENQADMMAGAKKAVEDLRARSPWWIVGTSLAFEAVIVALAMWVFCRRDY